MTSSGLASIVAAVLAAGSEPPAGAVTGLRQESGGRTFRLVVDLDHPAEFAYHSPEPSLVLLDFPGVARGRLPERIDPERPEVTSIRLVPFTDGRPGVRLEVRLSAFVPHRVAADGRSVALTLEAPEAPPAPALPLSLPPPPPLRPAVSPAPALTASPPPRRTTGGRIVRLAWSDREGTEVVVVGTDGPVRYRDFALAHPHRLVVDFPGASFTAPARPPAVGRGLVRRVRLGSYGEGETGVARLVVDLSGPAPYRIVATEAGLTISFGDKR
jgi:AMIN domain-containing protein